MRKIIVTEKCNEILTICLINQCKDHGREKNYSFYNNLINKKMNKKEKVEKIVVH